MPITPLRGKWKGEMTGRERFNNQMHYKPVDRCFNMEFGYWEENFREWDIFVDNGVKNNGDADIFFNFDEIAGTGGLIWMHPHFPSAVVEVKSKTRIVMNHDGLMAEVPLDNHDTIPHYLKSSINKPDDWVKCKKERFDRNDPARKINVEQLQNAHPKDRDYPLGVNCGSMIGRIRDMLTFEGLCYACYDYPDMVEDMVETACLLACDYLDAALPYMDFDYATGWEDICFKNGPIVSVEFFRDVVMPRYKRIAKKLREFGIDLWYTDCDGDVRPIMPYLMEGGINCLFPFEVNGCAHPSELFEKHGKELRIMGGVDKMALGSGKEAIADYLQTLVPLVKRGGYIPFCDHRCPPNVKTDDYLFYLDLKEEMFGMK